MHIVCFNKLQATAFSEYLSPQYGFLYAAGYIYLELRLIIMANIIIIISHNRETKVMTRLMYIKCTYIIPRKNLMFILIF